MERDEVRDMITAETARPLARIESAVDIIAVNIKHIEEHLATANSKTAANVLKIEEVRQKVEKLEQGLPHTPVNCPQNGTLQEMKTILEKIKEKKPIFEELISDYTTRKTKRSILKDSEDNRIKTQSEIRAEFLKKAALWSVVVAACALIINLTFSIVGFFQKRHLQEGQNLIKEEVDMINTPVRTRSGVIKWYPSGVIIDSLNARKDTLKVDW